MYLDSAIVGLVGKEGADIDRQWRAAKHAIFAYHVGRWRKGESPLAALARALDTTQENILAEFASHSTERDELDVLSCCLRADFLDLSELSIKDGVEFVVALINKKLAQVPPEIRIYFGAPQKLEPSVNFHFHSSPHSYQCLSEGRQKWTIENRAPYDRSKLRYPSDLTDEEWGLIAPLIPPAKRGGRKRSVRIRDVVNGLIYVLSTGCVWCAIPKDFPPKSTVHGYFDLWKSDGTLECIHYVLYKRWRCDRSTAAVVDSQSGLCAAREH